MATDRSEEPPIRGIEPRGEMTVADYWHEGVALHHEDSYASIPLLKFPEGLRVYERLIWDSKPDVNLELRCLEGGSTLWLRDQMAAASRYGSPSPRVASLDLDATQARANLAAGDRGRA